MAGSLWRDAERLWNGARRDHTAVGRYKFPSVLNCTDIPG